MKRIYYIAIALGFAAMAACSKSADILDLKPVSADDWATDETKAVPIIFGQGTSDDFTVKTKAPVERTLKDVQFGVLALDTTRAALWKTDPESVLLVNRVAKGVVVDEGLETAQFIEPSGPVTYYYPLKTEQEFFHTFYAYHTTDTKIESDAHAFDGAFDGTGDEAPTSFFVDVALDSTDVIWGKAVARTLPGTASRPGDLNGFNTKYVRESRLRYGDGWREYAPKLNFKHLTTAFHFKIIADPEDDQAARSLADENGKALVKINNVCLDSVYTRATLDVLKGTLSKKGERSSIQIVLPHLDGIYPKDAPTECGTGLFILPPSGNENLYVNFDLEIPRPSATETVTLTTPGGYKLIPPSGEFEVGRSYTFQIIVKSLEKITIDVTVDDWEDGFTDEDRENGKDVVVTIG